MKCKERYTREGEGKRGGEWKRGERKIEYLPGGSLGRRRARLVLVRRHVTLLGSLKKT